MSSRSLKIILECDGRSVRAIMSMLSKWLDLNPTKRKVMYIEQKVCEQFIIPDEEPMTRSAEMHRAFDHGFRASAKAYRLSVYPEDVENAWLENKKALL